MGAAGGTDTGSTEPGSQERRRGGLGDWLRNHLGFAGASSQEPEGEDESSPDGLDSLESPDTEDGDASKDPAAQPRKDGDAPSLSPDDLIAALEQLSDDELDRLRTSPKIGRLVQSETDRRENQRQREQAQLQTSQRTRTLEQQRSDALRDGNADEALDADEQLRQLNAQQEQARALHSLLETTVTQHDVHTLDIIKAALPEASRAALLAELTNHSPLEGRKIFVTKGLASLEAHWKAEGAKAERSRLRKDRGALKLVMADQRAGEEEPDVVPAAAPSRGRSDWLRAAVEA